MVVVQEVYGFFEEELLQMSKVKILNVPIDNLSMSELLEKLNRGVVYTPNVDHMVKLRTDQQIIEPATAKSCTMQRSSWGIL
jgi:UDP-N-acetyl-D-mannosaminuronic acid transferase (WecB/TagA/CpsF family)